MDTQYKIIYQPQPGPQSDFIRFRTSMQRRGIAKPSPLAFFIFEGTIGRQCTSQKSVYLLAEPLLRSRVARERSIASFNHLVCADQQRGRYLNSETLCRFQVDAKRKLGWLVNWDITGLCAFKNSIYRIRYTAACV
jgi:hypothetical protein